MKNKKQIKKLKLEVKNWANDVLFLQKSFDQQNINFQKIINKLESDCAKKIYELTLKVNDVFDCLNKNDFELVNKDEIFTNNNQKKHDSYRDIHTKDMWKKSLIENSVPITPKNSPMDQLIEMVAEGFKEGYLPSAIRVNKKGKIEYLKATIDRLQKEIVELKVNKNKSEFEIMEKSNNEIKKDILDSALNIENN